MEEVYKTVLNGGALEGDGKPGDKEAKIKMHIKTAAAAAKTIVESTADGTTPADAFYTGAQDVILPYLDSIHGNFISADDHSIFTKLTKKYEDRFMQDVRDLNVLDPDEITRVTEYGKEIADFVDKIVKNNFGYVTSDGSVYFDINAFESAGNSYARLEPWNRNDKDLLADGEGSLSNKTTEKRSDADFALWKASKPGEPSWDSPWGKGRPGWHIECSAMASATLGKQMDIHSGGIDLAFPHHDNELAQSEAYWERNHSHEQWVNYFLHMGHLSIQGSKMSKSLKNFTTIREALEKKEFTPRGLRIIFLLGGWKEGVEITDDLVKAADGWEDKVNNFFLNARDLLSQKYAAGTDTSLSTELQSAQKTVYDSLCDSFNTAASMAAISELITKFNSADKTALVVGDVEATARWVTSMVNTFGLNGSEGPDSTTIGWSGIDVPSDAKPYLVPLSSMRDTLRQAARSKEGISTEQVSSIVSSTSTPPSTDNSSPYSTVYNNFTNTLTSLSSDSNLNKEILSLCDRVRDTDLWDLGIYLEDRDPLPALIRPLTKELLAARSEKAARLAAKQAEKEKKEREAREKAEKGKLSHLEMFRTEEWSAWDEEGLPTKDAKGEEVLKSRSKKLRKEWERQKKLHEAWVAAQK